MVRIIPELTLLAVQQSNVRQPQYGELQTAFEVNAVFARCRLYFIVRREDQVDFKEGRPQMFDIFRREPRGRVVWMGTAHDEEEVRQRVRKLRAVNPGVYFAFDDSSQNKRTIKPYELDEANLEG